MDAPAQPEPEEFVPGQAVRFTGGKYNGFTGNLRWVGSTTASIVIQKEHQFFEIIEELKFVTDLVAWTIRLSETEKTLRT